MKTTYLYAPMVLAIAAASAPAMATEQGIAVQSAASTVVVDSLAVESLALDTVVVDEAAIELATKLDSLDTVANAGSETISAPSTVAASMSATDFALAPAAAAAPGEVAVTAAAAAAAQGDMGGRTDSYTVTLNQDAFFGFYGLFNGLIPVADDIDFSFYGILWTTPSFASTAIAGGGASGSDLWTEFGFGIAYYAMDGNLVIKPQIGLTNGALLSGGVIDATETPTGAGGNFADGIVPSLTMNYSDDAFEAEFYGGYYAALRNRNDAPALDFLHTWINAGVKVAPKFSLGAHYELLSNTRNDGGGAGNDPAVVYQWLGPYVQFSTDNGFFARFTAGADIEDGNQGDFYKLTAGFSF